MKKLFIGLILLLSILGCDVKIIPVTGVVSKVEHFPATYGYRSKTILTFEDNRVFYIHDLVSFPIGKTITCVGNDFNSAIEKCRY